MTTGPDFVALACGSVALATTNRIIDRVYHGMRAAVGSHTLDVAIVNDRLANMWFDAMSWNAMRGLLDVDD